jgi:hypothetical protein
VLVVTLNLPSKKGRGQKVALPGILETGVAKCIERVGEYWTATALYKFATRLVTTRYKIFLRTLLPGLNNY